VSTSEIGSGRLDASGVSTASGTLRRVMTALVLLAQTGFFLLFLQRPITVLSDNNRYEVAAYNLATGRGLSLPLSISSDPEVYQWVCSRHPESCHADTTHPTALYPPGYSVFVAGIYAVFGRSLMAVVAAQWLLLLLMFVLFEQMAARLLDRVGYLFAMGIAVSYPFLARQAPTIMSDHVHIVAVFGALAALYLMKPGLRRGVVFGGLMAFATLVRPYCLLVMPALWLWPSVRRAVGAGRREWLVAGALFVLVMGGWAARNTYWFGRFVPIGTGGPGVLLMHTMMEREVARQRLNDDAFYRNLQARIGGHDLMSREGDRRLQALARERIRENPGQFVTTILWHIPKLWISLGSATEASRAWPILVLYLGGLLLLGVMGGWLTRRDPLWHPLIITVGVYWVFLLYSPGEARRTLPLRLFMLLLGSVAASQLLSRARRALANQSKNVVPTAGSTP
jgi:hypothetical protein